MPGLDGKDKVRFGPDLSFDSQAEGTRYVDGFGHGTHMAGLIAGEDDGFDASGPDRHAVRGRGARGGGAQHEGRRR